MSLITVVENMFNLGCTATSFLDLLISVEDVVLGCIPVHTEYRCIFSL